MKPVVRLLFSLMLSLVLILPVTAAKSPPTYSQIPDWLYLDGHNSSVGIILCHGRKGNPDWYVVGTLRRSINKELGFHTLSIQMPGGDKHWQDFDMDFPEAYQAIQAGVDYLRREKGVTKIYLVGHSMGARMTSSYLAKYPMVDIAGYIGVSMLNNGYGPFDCKRNLSKVSLPVLDIYPQYGKFDDAMYGRERKRLVSPTYRQIMIPNANHAFKSKSSEKELSEAVISWLVSQNR